MQPGSALGPMLGRSAHLARARLEARLSRYEITPVQSHVLLYLFRCGGQALQGRVTEFLKVKPSTANGILDRMMEKGLVTRTVSGSDARQRLITLTEKGREKQTLFEKGFQESEAMLVRGFTPQETELFRNLLERIIQNLEEDRESC
ncbi:MULTISPECIES: MarR family winged helix-turn-helix transcriptional regulator [environmental samples]|jgi:DNA-binding MarR family transcriptional regulator|uniref:MarR family winged helix-turn-helix transcriptional regulator n=1 Tax=environmental samples TaxID=876090 RepID=UPI0003379DD8|nr:MULTISPECIES: MarR family winged helix-turn-helix transcriptional regulator [environmental samples]CDC67988.1 putative MarR family transcriptional regulator [Oscillibacter sp. CAG:155]